jgi:hypothetical protein
MLSCAAPIVSVLERNGDRVRLSQIQRKNPMLQKTLPDSTRMYSSETEKMLQEGYTVYDKYDDGENIMSVSLLDVTIVAKSRNIPERAGKISIDFMVQVPAKLIDNKWQVQLTPFADKNGKRIQFDKILLSGAQFLKQQKRGYQMYQNFVSSIIPDSAYMQRLFDEKGFQKALFHFDEQFYDAWRKDLLSQSRFIDWRSIRNKRNMLFNGKMERNRASVNPNDWKNILPAYWLEREITDISGKWKNFLSAEYDFEKKIITMEDSIEISKRFFDYKRMMENERKKALMDEKYNEYVRFPKESCRLDTVIRVGDNFEYYYSQNIDADENIKKIDVMIDGEVIALDESRYNLPPSDTLTYFISSMVQFLDRSPKYKRIIRSRHSQAAVTAYINFTAGSTRFVETAGNNKEEIDKVMKTLHKLTFTGELVLDSVNMIATASPEGNNRINLNLSEARAQELKKYLLQQSDYPETAELFQPRAIGEDWGLLTELIRIDENIKNRTAILMAVGSEKNTDAKEWALRKFDDYPYIRQKLYPRLRAVKFDFHLHRKEMVKDTIHTTVVDTIYMDAVQMMENRQYHAALEVLEEYNDQNTAVCLMSLGYDKRAIEILEALRPDENTLYLLSILYVRENRFDEAISAFAKACELDVSKWYRGNLDPEISKLIIDYNLNFE